MELTVNGEKRPCIMSAFTLVIYEQEFGGADLIADTSGKVTADDVVSDVVGQSDGDEPDLVELDEIVLLDFSKVPWTKVMKAAWAMLKTADDTVPHFEQWARSAVQVDSWEFREVVDKAVNDAFFHDASPVGEGE